MNPDSTYMSLADDTDNDDVGLESKIGTPLASSQILPTFQPGQTRLSPLMSTVHSPPSKKQSPSSTNKRRRRHPRRDCKVASMIPSSILEALRLDLLNEDDSDADEEGLSSNMSFTSVSSHNLNSTRWDPQRSEILLLTTEPSPRNSFHAEEPPKKSSSSEVANSCVCCGVPETQCTVCNHSPAEKRPSFQSNDAMNSDRTRPAIGSELASYASRDSNSADYSHSSGLKRKRSSGQEKDWKGVVNVVADSLSSLSTS